MLLPARWLRQAIFVVISGRARPHAEKIWLLCPRPATAVQSSLDRAVPARPRRQLSGQPPSTPAGGGLPPAHRAVGSTVAASKGAPWPPFTPQAPSLPPESRRACGCDAVAVREAVPRVQRGRTRPEASLLPLAHRRRRSMRCGAHLLIVLGAGRPVGAARGATCRSRARPVKGPARGGDRSKADGGDLGRLRA